MYVEYSFLSFGGCCWLSVCRVSQQSNTTARILHYKMLYLANVNICAGLFSMRYKRVFICASNAAECLGLSMCAVCAVLCLFACSLACYSSVYAAVCILYTVDVQCTLYSVQLYSTARNRTEQNSTWTLPHFTGIVCAKNAVCAFKICFCIYIHIIHICMNRVNDEWAF